MHFCNSSYLCISDNVQLCFSPYRFSPLKRMLFLLLFYLFDFLLYSIIKTDELCPADDVLC